MKNQNETQTNKNTKHEGAVKMDQNYMITYITFEKALLHFGVNAWFDHIGNDDEYNEVYAVYNDDFDNTLQLGTITEVNGSTFIVVEFIDKNIQPSITYFKTLNEFTDWMEDLDHNPDFTYIGSFDTIEQIYEEFNYQGFNNQEIIQLSKNHYGNILEIARIEDEFIVYVGAR